MKMTKWFIIQARGYYIIYKNIFIFTINFFNKKAFKIITQQCYLTKAWAMSQPDLWLYQSQSILLHFG
ncbi:hypothetical protein THIOM_002495 [Candidatus Thiomargarita nelsonii]|uniref:Uncharacterized protein n=1 Tax=Candidatus Thiomargarita nelsonii TaxID=1003181 RepID=A0A176S139_9GAMM|nr:hypothetical protein THIOM_002495 [Candidatus Thiomargarita nelsonii]